MKITIVEMFFIWILVSLLGSMLVARFIHVGKGKKDEQNNPTIH